MILLLDYMTNRIMPIVYVHNFVFFYVYMYFFFAIYKGLNLHDISTKTTIMEQTFTDRNIKTNNP